MNLLQIAVAVGTVIGCGGALGLVWASLRSNLSAKTIEMLETNNKAWKERSDLQELQIHDLEHKLDLANIQIEGDRLRIQTLESVAGAGAAIALLQTEMIRQHDQVMAALASR